MDHAHFGGSVSATAMRTMSQTEVSGQDVEKIICLAHGCHVDARLPFFLSRPGLTKLKFHLRLE